MGWRRWVVGALVMLASCGSEVVVEDESLLAEEPGATGGLADGELRPGCEACATGECGWCAYEGEDSYRCRGDEPPVGGYGCLQTGSVYADEAGLYICWRCDG